MELNITFEFIDSINKADLNRLSNLISENHVFIDSQGNKMKGKQNILDAWEEYFHLFPDYKIEAIESFRNADSVVLIGYASGTYQADESNPDSNHWKVPAAWKAIVKNNKVEFWQVFADNSVVFDIINKAQHLSNM